MFDEASEKLALLRVNFDNDDLGDTNEEVFDNENQKKAGKTASAVVEWDIDKFVCVQANDILSPSVN